jgi:dGTPase
VGERVLDGILGELGVEEGFKHEMHGLRVVDMLTNYGAGLNLTYEVRDGIVTHCGESFDQQAVPDRGRELYHLEHISDRTCFPATLEGCLVRMVDRVAYLGRDLEDGIAAGVIKKSDVPRDVARELGTDNGKIIGLFVNDLIANSLERDAIVFSKRMFELMNSLKEFNYEHIYRNPDVMRKARKVEHILRELFFESMRILEESDRGRNAKYVAEVLKDAPSMSVLFDFIKNTNYNEETPLWRVVTDYVAGMTDLFAERTYAQLFLPKPVI